MMRLCKTITYGNMIVEVIPNSDRGNEFAGRLIHVENGKGTFVIGDVLHELSSIYWEPFIITKITIPLIL